MNNNPPNPTPEMIEAGKAALNAGWHDKSKEWEAVIASVYLAMRAAERPPHTGLTDVERDKHALRWIFEHGLKHSTERPDFVNEALSDAMEPARAALNPIPEKDGQ